MIGARVVLLFASLLLGATLVVLNHPAYLLILVPLIIYQCIEFFRFQVRSGRELEQFVESIKYRDFSRHFDESRSTPAIQSLRKSFNEINSTFQVISKEKETQYQYLQKILELVDTGILSYEEETGDVVWMNESLKRLVRVPYLKTIHSMERRFPALYEQILRLRPGVTDIASIRVDNSELRILLSATAFQTDGQVFRLVAFQNVNEALDETESKAWQRLLSVLTHEIMNSVAPISSLAETMKNRLQAAEGRLETDECLAEDLGVGIETIRRRSEGLLKFAETYRSLNKITRLNAEPVLVRDVFENLLQLMQPTLEQKNIEIDTILKEMDLRFEVDPTLIEQVLINLVVNAIDAVKERPDPRISLTALRTAEGRVIIRVADNGAGMPEDVMENIFIPFFSTKKNGSGIGLSLCKQIMMLHKGNIQVQSVEGAGSVFLLNF